MPKSEFVEYNGERFYLQSSKKYFQSGRKDCVERSLHRRVWSDVHGPIPDGMVIHHIDGDWRNNNINNLELLDNKEHCQMHMAMRWKDQDQSDAFKKGLEAAQEEAKKWHSSEEGRAWHSENARKSWGVKIKHIVNCVACDAEIQTYFPKRTKTCSKSCRQKISYKNRFTLKAGCQRCGIEFLTSRYKPSSYCSRKCSNVDRLSKAA